MVWQLLQVRMMADRPIVFVGPMWRGLRGWVEAAIVERGLASPADLDIAVWVDTLEEALEVVRRARDEFLRRNKVILPPPAVEAPAEGSQPG
jgi:predicted Rossmann-fold nucleotide-binding protein